MADETETHLSRPLLRLEEAYANFRPTSHLSERTFTYGQDEHQHLLVFGPSENNDRHRLIFYVHGDGWRGGHTRRARFIGKFLAEEGYTVAICGFRAAPQSIFPAQLEDVFSGIAEILEHRGEFHTTDGMILAGFGSGAHLASLVAFDQEQQTRHCMPREMFAGLLCLSGMLDFSACRDEAACRDIRALMGGRRGWDAADPMRHVNGDEELPVLAVHGADDHVAPPDAARAFVVAANGGREDGPAHLLVMPGAHHDDVLRLFIERRAETEAVVEWLAQRTAEGEGAEEQPQLCLVGETEKV